MDITDYDVKSWHLNIFLLMDQAYCNELDKELTDYRLRREAERQEQARQKRKKR